MSKADKLVSGLNYIEGLKKNGISGVTALFTGVNKDLENYKETEEFKKRR